MKNQEITLESLHKAHPKTEKCQNLHHVMMENARKKKKQQQSRSEANAAVLKSYNLKKS